MPLRLPLPHQKEALRWAVKRQKIALFMEMRLGKTLVVVRWAAHHGARKPLVIAPLSTHPDWEDELRREQMAPHVLRPPFINPDELSHGWFLTNYECVLYHPEIFDFDFDALILDESTRIKNPTTKITKLLQEVAPAFPLRAIMSGFPAPENPMEYFPQFLFLRGHFCGHQNFWKFRHDYFHKRWYDWIPKTHTRERIKAEVHKNAYVLKRKQVKIGGRKFYERRFVSMMAAQRRMHDEAEKEFSLSGGEVMTKFAVVKANWMSRIAGGFDPTDLTLPAWGAKIIETVKLITELNQPVVVWCRYNAEIRVLVRALRDAGINAKPITGKTKLPQRAERIRRFRKNKINALVIQSAVGKEGIDLSHARTAIYYSNSYSNQVRHQSEDRLVHPTKKDPILIIDMISEGSVDEDVVQLLREKKAQAGSLLSRLRERLHDKYKKEK